MSQKTNSNNIFVDTNILIGYYTNQKQDVEALNYLYSLKGKKLFVSSLSILQLVAFFQNKKLTSKIANNLKIKSRKDLIEAIKLIQHRFHVLSCSNEDITEAIRLETPDVEDNVQYVIGGKMKCFYYITNNIKDYQFININAISPTNIRLIRK